MSSISQSIHDASLLIAKTSTSALIDSQVLMCHVLKCNSAYLATWPEKKLNNKDNEKFHNLVNKRSEGTPVAYLTGEREFWSLSLNVTPDTLIPRPETELIIETILSNFQNQENINIVDLGTGSGAIAIALASEKKHWNITATDISENALNVSRNNAKKHSINNVNFVNSNWFDSLSNQTFDIVISNPPYIALSDTHLNEGDVRFEPQNALVSGNMGMDDITKITAQATKHLNKGGWLFLEHGYDQKALVCDCFNTAGFANVSQLNDLSGNPRLTFGQH